MHTKIISRIAPTPSGFLHLGNITSFYNTWKYVREKDGVLWLRIDDCDASRMRPEFVQDIFDTLNFLGIDWDAGPKDTDDFFKNYSQNLKIDHYRDQLKKIKAFTYACECSRRDVLKLSDTGIYPGTCLNKNLEYQKDKTCLRVKTNNSIDMGDFVIWRKDDLPAYQLVSLIDDLEMEVNTIFRGEDLRASTQAQLYLNKLIGGHLDQVKIYHHPLLLDENGRKLSKGEKAFSIKDMRQAGLNRKEILAKVQIFNSLPEK